MKIWRKTEEYSEGKFLIIRRDGSVPHWPHFVLGARDPASAIALRAYADACAEQGSETDYIQSVRDLADDFDAYRAHEGDGDREAGPHRKDDPAVIEVMRGSDATIRVMIDRQNTPKGKLNI